MLLPLAIVSVIALVCVTVVVLTACMRRKGGVRGFLRAGPVHFGIEIDASPPDDKPEELKP